MKFGKLSLSLLCSVVLTGCATDNRTGCGEYFAEDEAPSTGVCVREVKSNSNVAALIGAIDLDLSMLIDMALENNPETKHSWHLARIAKAHVGQASSAFYPTVIVGGQVARTESNVPINKTTRQITLNTAYYPSVEIHYSLFQFGASRDIAEAAKQALCAANCQYNRTIQTVIHDVQKAYFALCSAESTVAAHEHNLNDAIVAHESAFMRYQSGLISIQEYLQAKANKSQTEFELERSRSFVESARAALANAAGIKVSEAIYVLHPVIPPNTSDVDRSIDDIMSDVVRTRPDVAAAYANVRANKYISKAALAKIFPELVIGGTCSRKRHFNIPGNFDNFNIFVGFTWKIFDGFKNIYDILEVKEHLGIARQDLRAAELRAQTEVWTHYFAFKSANKQLQAARVLEQSAKESFESMETSFENGLCKFTDLMSAQSCLANARKQRIVSENNLLTSLSDLAYSTGGVVGFDLIKNK
ncbi:MAG: TolC family protein [Puniceicoccales bacterium]|jgi:outer membrane protein|nr:TolC family protein [Puniceicoccales bacterium]